MELSPALAAFRRLLADAERGGQNKIDALIALSQRTVLVPTWSVGSEDFRALVSSDGVHALPIFSGEDELENAARRFGWMGADGKVPHREVGSRAAFRHMMALNLAFVVVDIAAAHAMEVESDEIQPLLRTRGRTDSSGAFAGVGRISSYMMKKVRGPSSASFAAITPSAESDEPERIPTKSGVIPADVAAAAIRNGPRTPAVRAPDASAVPSTTLPTAVPTAVLTVITPYVVLPVPLPPADLILDASAAVLREYPEVEWAAYIMLETAGDPRPAIGVRIDQSFLTRQAEIGQALITASGGLALIFIDEMPLMRSVRADGVMFFPWRRRPTL